MKGNIKLELKTLTPVRLQSLLSRVSVELEGNANFNAPPITAVELQVLAGTFMSAITNAKDGSLIARKHRDAQSEKVRNVLRLIADYVRMVAQGDRAILSTSGFSLVNEPAASRRMEAPEMKRTVMTGRAGELQLRWSGVRNRRAYQISMTDTDPAESDTQWTMIAVTGKITYYVTGLVPYKLYWFRVSAIGAMGEGVQSLPMPGRAA
ncbi:MAG: fibronectin type III domain-containing protein [Flavobacteriales bacterium]